MSGRSLLHLLRATLVASLALVGTSCFEDPVDERLQLEVKDKDRIAISLKVSFSVGEDSGKGPLETRIRELRERMLHGQDDWSRRFDLISPLSETMSWHREEGHMRSVEREALIEGSDLPRFLSDTALTFNFTHGSGWSELTIYPGKSTRASEQQKVLLSGRLDEWCGRVSLYLAALSDVYQYLGGHPERAEAVMGTVLREEMSDEDRARLATPTDDELKMVAELNLRMNGVSSILLVSDEEAFSLNELSNLAFDPFPAVFTIALPSKVIEREGFESITDHTVRVPHLTFWDALPAMRERWIAPDPLPARVEASRDRASDGKLDLRAFLALERHVTAVPSPSEVKAALLERLKPRARYRVRWADTAAPGTTSPH
jgi:hypothetical protein